MDLSHIDFTPDESQEIENAENDRSRDEIGNPSTHFYKEGWRSDQLPSEKQHQNDLNRYTQ